MLVRAHDPMDEESNRKGLKNVVVMTIGHLQITLETFPQLRFHTFDHYTINNQCLGFRLSCPFASGLSIHFSPKKERRK